MNLIERARKLILSPTTEWAAIAAEQPSVVQIFTGYVVPLALIPALGQLIGTGLFGRDQMSAMTSGIATAVISFVSSIAGVYLTALIVDFLAPNFGSQKNFGRAVQLVAYSYTPAWLAGILHIVPALGFLVFLASLYGLFLVYLGLPPTMKTPGDRVVIYLVVTIVAVIIVSAVLAALLGVIVFGMIDLGSVSMTG